MTTQQTPTTDISDVDLIKRRDLVTFALVAYVNLSVEPLMEVPERFNPRRGKAYWHPEWNWWKEDSVDHQFEMAYERFDDVSLSTIDE
jgi:hypothetical protein